jgi:hypothetical protein
MSALGGRARVRCQLPITLPDNKVSQNLMSPWQHASPRLTQRNILAGVMSSLFAKSPTPASPVYDRPPLAFPVTLTIDGRQVTLTVPKGTLVVDAAAKLGIEIPVFCSHPKLDPVACCRMCLVEISGPRGMMLQTACSVPVAQDMVVKTDTQQVQDVQEANLAFILLNHPLDCPICDKGGECPLQDQTMRFGPGLSQLVEAKRHKHKHYLISDTIVLDQERCVVCWRCIRYLEEWEDKPQLALFERGGKTIIDIQDGTPVDAKTSGNIIDICPVGALTNRVARFSYRPWEIERTPSICTHCSMGCNIRMDTARTNCAASSAARTCRSTTSGSATRGASPRLGQRRRSADHAAGAQGRQTWQPAPWSEALALVAEPLAGDQAAARRRRNRRHRQRQAVQREQLPAPALHAPVDRHQQHRPPRRRRCGRAAHWPARPGRPDEAAVWPKPQARCDLALRRRSQRRDAGARPASQARRARGKAQLVIAHPRQIELTRYNGPFLQYTPGSEVTLLNGLLRLALGIVKTSPSSAQDRWWQMPATNGWSRCAA